MRKRLILALGLLGVFLLLPSFGALAEDEDELNKAFAGITESDLLEHLEVFASPQLEGRDSPSRGLEAAAQYIEGRFRSLGLKTVGSSSYRHGYNRRLPAPVASKCNLSIGIEGDATESLELGQDFVPYPRTSGEAAGPAVFCGYGIVSKKPRWNSLKGKKLKGAIAVIIEGEPRHAKLFEGETITAASDTYVKLKNLADAGAVGAIIIRRPHVPEERESADSPLKTAELGYRYTWANWLNTHEGRRATPSARMPVVEISLAVAERLLGTDPEELAQRGDRAGRPLRHSIPKLHVALSTEFDPKIVMIDNVVASLEGSDPKLKAEYIVVGAHYDHIGVDSRGRIGLGADDNGSGSAALLEIAEAMVAARPRRSILFCAFSAEEDGLVGSRAIAQAPPIPIESMAAMINLDMIGRGDPKLVVALGVDQNPGFKSLLKRASQLNPTGIKRIVTNKAAHLWTRSDHHSFHTEGVPVLFFFEAIHESENPDYHTFRDTIESLSLPKVLNTAKLAFNTAWLLADDDERPPKPSGK